jgi:glucose dehydrogenase
MNGTMTVTGDITVPLPIVLKATPTGTGTLRLAAPMTWLTGTVSLAGGLEVGADWPSYNRTLKSGRFSALDQINRSNASKLKQPSVYDLNVDTSFQTGPIVIGRTLYATTDKEILAMDAETCRQEWRVREEGPSVGLAVNRGAGPVQPRSRGIFR